MTTLNEILNDRSKTHGKYGDQAQLSVRLKRIMKTDNLSFVQQEALDMICHKMARIVCGDPDFADHWLDIAGYAQLVYIELDKNIEEVI